MIIKSAGGYRDGLFVLAPSDVPRDALIFITSKYHHAEIRQQLLAMGFAEAKIVNLGKLIYDMARAQYFDLEAMPHAEQESFADVGALNGDTARAFLDWADGTCNHVYCFEPDTKNIAKCRENLTDLDQEGKLTIIPKGAWSAATTLSFCEKANGTSAIGEGNARIETTTLDEVFMKRPITFIKMDIEGAEAEALRGAERTIRTQRPKLAISVYHKPEDIIDIPRMLLEYQPDYRFYLRHYCIFANETILYAI